ADTANALGAAGLRVGVTPVRVGAAAEVALAVAALVAPGPVPGILVAVSYVGFAAFITGALVRGWPLASCGCFGRADTQPTVAHLALNVAAAVAAGWWAVASHATVANVFVHQPWAGVPLGLATAVCCLLAYVVFTDPLTQVRRGQARRAQAGQGRVAS
ncbi:MAG: MauE/DoxX family redox-associated membrane protein, partial [Acidimicrobiales bacterium]